MEQNQIVENTVTEHESRERFKKLLDAINSDPNLLEEKKEHYK